MKKISAFLSMVLNPRLWICLLLLNFLNFLGIQAGLAKNQPINFPCILRLAKSDCWPNYQVMVQPLDAETQQPLGDPVVLDKNADEMEVLIPCKPEQEISFQATTLPAVWGATVNTEYPASHFWQAPGSLPQGANRWIISLCFATDFSSVPIPLTAKPTCTCTFPPVQNTVESIAPSL